MTVVNKLKSLTARATMSPDDVRSFLEKDHDETKELLARIMDTTQGNRRMKLLKQLKTALTAHSRAEERAVYDRMLKTSSEDSRDLADEGYVEHRIVDQLLAELANGEPVSTRWHATAKVLKELVEHHIAEEQTDTFAELGEHFDSDELDAMGVEFLRAKAAILERAARARDRRGQAARVPRRPSARKSTRVAPRRRNATVAGKSKRTRRRG